MGWYTVRPISDRTQFRKERRTSQFKASWSATETLLHSEIKHLNGKDVFIEIDVEPKDIRNDGRLRANARPASAAVRVVFDSVYGPLSYASAAFDTGRAADWQHNVRAIALGLEALRKVDRYGITRKGEQYLGFKAIGAGPDSEGMTSAKAYEVLKRYARVDDDRPYAGKDLLKRARRYTHPDVTGGDHSAWHAVEVAARVLGLFG